MSGARPEQPGEDRSSRGRPEIEDLGFNSREKATRYTHLPFDHLNRQSKRLSPLRSWVQFSLRTHDTYVKRVS